MEELTKVVIDGEAAPVGKEDNAITTTGGEIFLKHFHLEFCILFVFKNNSFLKHLLGFFPKRCCLDLRVSQSVHLNL